MCPISKMFKITSTMKGRIPHSKGKTDRIDPMDKTTKMIIMRPK